MMEELPAQDAREREIRQGVRAVTDFVARRREIIDRAARQRPGRPLGKSSGVSTSGGGGSGVSSCRAQVITNSETLLPTVSARFLIRSQSAGSLR